MTAMEQLAELMSDEKQRDRAQAKWYIRETVTNQRTGATEWHVWTERPAHQGLPFHVRSADGERGPMLVWLEYIVALHNEALDRVVVV